jgi:Tat protein secretion system quality control protein TatD with DNase activity
MAFWRDTPSGVKELGTEKSDASRWLLHDHDRNVLSSSQLAEIERALLAGDRETAREFVLTLASAYRRLHKLVDYADGTQQRTFDRCLKLERDTIEQTLAAAIAESGLTPQQFAERYGYEVQRSFEGMRFTVKVRILPLIGPLRPVREESASLGT